MRTKKAARFGPGGNPNSCRQKIGQPGGGGPDQANNRILSLPVRPVKKKKEPHSYLAAKKIPPEPGHVPTRKRAGGPAPPAAGCQEGAAAE